MYESTKTAFELRTLVYAQDAGEEVSCKDAEDLADKMILAVNSITFDAKHFAKAVVEGMPIKQCEICIQMFLTLMQKMSERSYDLRNKAAHDLSCTITENFPLATASDSESPACAYAELVCINHRTLQQSLVRLWVELIYEINSQMKKMGYDSDHAATIEKTNEILKYAEKYSLPFI